MKELWIEKYRPKKLSEIVSQEESISILTNTLKTGELPHLLLYGSPGTGKTSSILALCNELFGALGQKIKQGVGAATSAVQQRLLQPLLKLIIGKLPKEKQ